MLLRLDFADDTPIYLQIRNQIVLGIAGGELAPGENAIYEVFIATSLKTFKIRSKIFLLYAR